MEDAFDDNNSMNDSDVKDDWDVNSDDEEQSTTNGPTSPSVLPKSTSSTAETANEKAATTPAVVKQKAGGEFATLVPSTADDYDALANLVKKRMVSLEGSPFYSFTLEMILKELAMDMSVVETKKIVTILNSIANEKQRKEKGATGKTKGRQKAVLKMERGIFADDADDVDDFDDV